MKKLIGFALAAFVLVAVVNNPDGSADTVSGLVSSFSTFVTQLTD